MRMCREMYYFFAFVILFIYVMYSRRTVREAFQLQQSISTAFTEENFGGTLRTPSLTSLYPRRPQP